MFITSKELSEKLRDGGREYAFFFDVDGTLADFNDNPDAVTVPTDIEDALIEISKKHSVIFVSGRNADFIQKLFPRLNTAFSASHGSVIKETPESDIKVLVNDLDKESLLANIDEEISKAGLEGLRVEVADFSCNIHFRNTNVSSDVVQQIAENACVLYNKGRQEEDQLHLTHGDKVIEIGPQGEDKGSAIHRFMSLETMNGKMPVFWGDALADSPAVKMVKEFDGVSIGVGDTLKEHVDYTLDNPAAARETIRLLAA